MLRRIIYFFLVTVIFGGLAGLIAYYAFDFKPKMIAQDDHEFTAAGRNHFGGGGARGDLATPNPRPRNA